MEQIFSEVSEMIKDVFGNAHLDIRPETSPEDVDEWNSLNHVLLMDAIEKHFNIKFDLEDMLNMNNVQDICKSIEKK